MTDLSNPNRDELLKKWHHIVHDKTFRLFTWTTLAELAWIAEYASRATNYLEIGAYAGRSTKVVCLANPKVKVTVLDTWDDDGVYEDFQHNLREEIQSGQVAMVRGSSQETIKNLPLDPPHGKFSQFDACWIDAGHLEHLVKADCENTIPLMMPGSLMSGHDYYAKERNDVYRGVHSAIKGPIGNPVDSIWTHQL